MLYCPHTSIRIDTREAMSQQDYDNVQEEADSSDEIHHHTGEPEFDEETLRSNERRSRFFFAAMCFLIALLFLSVYLNHLTSLNDTILQLGIVFFAAIGIFLLMRGSTATYKKPRSPRERHEEYSEEREDAIEEAGSSRPSLTPFEVLVQEALASIPEEFHER